MEINLIDERSDMISRIRQRAVRTAALDDLFSIDKAFEVSSKMDRMSFCVALSQANACLWDLTLPCGIHLGAKEDPFNSKTQAPVILKQRTLPEKRRWDFR